MGGEGRVVQPGLMVMVCVVATVTMVVVPCCSAMGRPTGVLQRLEDRTKSDWASLWSEERLALCRFRLRHNLEAICGKDVFRRSPTPSTLKTARHKRSSQLAVTSEPKSCITKHDSEGGSSKHKKDSDGKSHERGVSDSLPATRYDISPSPPDTGQKGTQTRSPFLSVQEASLFVTTWTGSHHHRGRYRRHASSITAECCTPAGCTWEEYAEYCPSSARLRVHGHDLI